MDPFHERLACVALDVAASYGFALAGRYAVQAHGSLDPPRPVTLSPYSLPCVIRDYNLSLWLYCRCQLELLADPAAQQRIAQSQQEIAHGEGLSLDQVEQLMAERSGRHGA